MKTTTKLLLTTGILICILTGCNNPDNNNKTSGKELELQKKELDLKQKELELKEKQLALDSAQKSKPIEPKATTAINQMQPKKETSITETY